MAAPQSYTTTLITGEDGHVYVPVPFDPDAIWGVKRRHTIVGTVAGMGVRGVILGEGDVRRFVLGRAWRRDCGLAAGDHVAITIDAEGPQRADLADDVAAALDADPSAGAAFDALAQFYRNAFLRWIDSTKRRPDQRPVRIAEMIELLRAGKKERP